MTGHLLEVWAAVFAAFAAGSVIGWLLYRWIDRTDYAWDQRDLAERIATRFGRRQVDHPTEPPAAFRDVDEGGGDEARPRPTRRRRSGEAGTAAATALRDRVRGSDRAAEWQERRHRDGGAEAEPSPGSGRDRSVLDEAIEVARAAAAADHSQRPGLPAVLASPGRSGRRPADQSRPVETARARPAPLPAPDDEPDAAEAAADDDPAATARVDPPALWPGRQLMLPDLRARPSQRMPSVVQFDAPPIDAVWEEIPPEAEPEPEGELDLERLPQRHRPAGLPGPPTRPDNLRKIKGIGARTESRLHQLGIYRYGQISAWTAPEQEWIGRAIGSPGRVEQEGWPEQARSLVEREARRPRAPRS